MEEKNSKGKAPLNESEQKKLEIIKAYVAMVGDNNLFPTYSDFLERGITRNQIRHHHGNISTLRSAAKEAFPLNFSGVLDVAEFTSLEYKARLNKIVKKYKRFVISTAVNGQQVHEGFLKSLEGYCDKNNAALLLIPSHDPAHNLDNQIEWHFDDALLDYSFVFDNLQFNSNIHISEVRVNAKQINPATGLGRFAQSEGSAIFGSPKQSLEIIPVSNIKYPHALMSTGACTLPNYNSTLGNSQRTAFIAQHDHKIGAIILEIENDKMYHFRQIQSDDEGGFCDLGKYYFGSKVKKISSKLAIGDYHAGDHAIEAENAWKEVCKIANVDEVILHDLHNGLSTNHHDQHKMVTQARRAVKGELNAIRELGLTGAVLNLWTGLVEKVTVTKSNHDEFLERWLDEARFSKDPYNFQVGCKLADKMVDGEDPLVVGVTLYGNLKKPKKINWLKRDQDYRIAGIECGAHGDIAGNGTKGSKMNIEKSFNKAVIGHSHTPGILREVFQIGTTSRLRLDYTKGPSSWLHCSCLIYPNGQRQLIIAIEGSWRLK